ncbi:MAG: metallophosphoesterase family protein [Dissulfurispiraceae bacterium]
MGLRIFHTSDLHLGLRFAGYPEEVSKKLIDARFETLKRLVDVANIELCDMFVVSGDLFDRLTVSKKDVVKAAQILSEFQGRVVVVLPGNHDFVSAGRGDIWSQFKESKGDNVLLLEKREVCSLKAFDLNVDLYPATCDSKHSKTNYLAWIKEAEKDPEVKFHGLAGFFMPERFIASRKIFLTAVYFM